jgi:hypothetical protein
MIAPIMSSDRLQTRIEEFLKNADRAALAELDIRYRPGISLTRLASATMLLAYPKDRAGVIENLGFAIT